MIGVGDRLPAATVLYPEPTSITEVAGDGPALLVFFKESCGTCQLALPVYQHWASQIPVVGISQDDLVTTEAFFAEHEITMDVAYDAPGFEASSAFDIEAVPALFLVEDGTVTRSWMGWSAEKSQELGDHLANLTGTDSVLVGADALPPFRPG